jgi:hypothetical protein
MRSFPFSGKARSISTILVLGLLLALSLTACTNIEKPIIYGIWNQFDAPLSSVNRIDANGMNNAVIVANPNGLSVFQFITKHNYSSPVSPDGKLIAVYSLAADGFWELQIRTTQVEQGDALFIYPVGEQLARYIEGFSSSNKYYAFTSQDPDTGILSVQIFDIAAKTLLETIPGAFFVDFFPGSDDLVILSIGPDGAVAGVQQVAIADQSINKLYEPPAEEQIGFMHVTRDGKSLLIYDIATKMMSKVEFGSGEHNPIYQYAGTNNAGNFDPNGNYLMLTDLSQEKQLVVLLDDNLAEVVRVEGIQSGFISFSENAQYFSYMLTASEKLELVVKDIAAGTAYSIADDGVFYRSGFSPDSKHIVFIDYKGESDKTGELYVSVVDGSSKILLDSGVSSFDFGTNNTIVYFKINEESGSPVSSMIRIGFDGKNKTDLLSSQPGIFSFIR